MARNSNDFFLTQNILNIISVIIYIIGYIIDNQLIIVLGGIGMTIYLTSFLGKLLLFSSFIVFAFILCFIIHPWYQGLFLAAFIYSVFQAGHFIYFVFNIKEERKLFDKLQKVETIEKKKKDIIYSQVELKDKDKYQNCFESIIEVIDIDNETNRTLNQTFNRSQSQKDWETEMKIVTEFMETTGLKAIVVQTMVEQYLFADIIVRGMYKHQWIDRVMNRNEFDDFPDSNFIYYKVMKGNP